MHLARPVSPVAVICAALTGALVLTSCGDDKSTDSGDTAAPAGVSDLVATVIEPDSAELSWSAPGDDGRDGRADYFELRKSVSMIDDANWDAATLVRTGRPPLSGERDTVLVGGLDVGTWFFRVRVADDVPNWSPLSNEVSVVIETPPVPMPITDLRVTAVTPSIVELAWTAPEIIGDDGAYDLRYGATVPTEETWASATQVEGVPSPAAAGTEERFVVDGLDAGSEYYFAVRVSSGSEELSGVSNTVPVTLLQVRRLTTSTHRIGALNPEWSPDGTQIVMEADFHIPGGGFPSIWTVPAGGGEPVLFTSVGFALAPSWSSLSDRIAFTSEADGGPGPDGRIRELSVVDAYSAATPRVVMNQDPYDLGDVVWSPDGREIAYEVLLDVFPRRAELWVLDMETLERRKVLESDRYSRSASWSPESDRLLYSVEEESDHDLWIVDLASGMEQRVTNTPTIHELFGAWSPDGRRIAFASDETGTLDVWIMDVTGENRVRITDGPDLENAPAWSPSGEELVHVVRENGIRDLWVTTVPPEIGDRGR
ncbi:MAG: fibronectin type III domain-containing protein [Candidatus Eisenbacteria bacterium]